jgi:hypothetical protein
MSQVGKNNIEELHFENEPSELDEATHAELLMMHNQSCTAILFAKNLQWKTVGATLLVFGANIAISHLSSENSFLISVLGWFCILLALAAVLVLCMYQAWQFNETQKIVMLEKHLSTLYRRVRDVKSRREGNYHRYTMLIMMVSVLIAAAFVSNTIIAHLL